MSGIKSYVCALLLLMCCSQAMSVCSTIGLSSIDYQYSSREMNGVVINMQVQQKWSKSACTQGYSYGFNGPQIWVNHGCRARFSVCFSQESAVSVTCSSYDYQPDACVIPSNGKTVLAVTVQRKYSRSACTSGISYSFDQSKIYVSNGCRAKFTVILRP